MGIGKHLNSRIKDVAGI